MTLKQALAAPIGTTVTTTDRRHLYPLDAAGYFPIRIHGDREFTLRRMSGPPIPISQWPGR